MHTHDDKYPVPPGLEPDTYKLQAPADTNEPAKPAKCLWGTIPDGTFHLADMLMML